MVKIKRRLDNDDHCGCNNPTYIVVHDTGNYTDTDEGNANYFCTGTRDSSAHYFVDDDSITQVVEDYNGAYHCGDGGGIYGITNHNSIGIEMCRVEGTTTQTTRDNTIELIATLMRKYNIPNDRVVRHYDASRKNCPASLNYNNWQGWIDFKNKLNNYIANGYSFNNGFEVKKVDNIVIYSNSIDQRAAEYLADFLKCPTISSETQFDFSLVKNIYAVGGNRGTYTSYLKNENFITGTDRYETVKAVLKRIGKL